LRITKTPPMTSTMMPQMTPIQTALLSLLVFDDPCGVAWNTGGLEVSPAFWVTGSAVDVELLEEDELDEVSPSTAAAVEVEDVLAVAVLVLVLAVEDDVEDADDVDSLEAVDVLLIEDEDEVEAVLELVEPLDVDEDELALDVELLLLELAVEDDEDEDDVTDEVSVEEVVLSPVLMGRTAGEASLPVDVVSDMVEVLSVEISDVLSALTAASIAARATSAVEKRAMATVRSVSCSFPVCGGAAEAEWSDFFFLWKRGAPN